MFFVLLTISYKYVFSSFLLICNFNCISLCCINTEYMSILYNCIPLPLQTAAVGSMERWVCSRLYSTVLQCEQGLEASKLHTVTSALHSFWVHSLCDVYMVRSNSHSGAGMTDLCSAHIRFWKGKCNSKE